MKNNYILIVLLFPLVVLAQPQGKLFIHSGFVSGSELGFIQYPQNLYHFIDSIDLDDMLVVNDQLLVSNDKIYFYDIAALAKIDSINTNNAYLMDYDNNRLVVAKMEAPFLEVYNLSSKNLIFSLNANKVKSQPIDILIDMDRAYLLYDTSLVVVDLNLQDTIATIATASQNFFPAYNQYLINKGNKVYIDVEFATGAPRFSILSLDKSTLQLENVLFYEFVDTPFEPVLAGNKLYMSFFPSYYDIAADTFVYFQNSNTSYPLCFDANSNTIFLYQPLNFNVNYFNNDTYSPDVSVPTYINKAVFYNEGSSGIAQQNGIASNISIYPNPASDEINILLPIEKAVKEIRMIAINGEQTVISINQTVSHQKLDISHLADGMYIVEIQCEKETYKTRFVKKNIRK